MPKSLDASPKSGLSLPLMRTLLLLLLALPAHSGPLSREEVPDTLKSWVNWALRGRERELCTRYHNQDNRACDWPGTLKLSLGDKSGRFEQAWNQQAEDWAFLPGGPEQWPQDVRVDGAPAVVLRRGESPALRLKPGRHVVTGAFAWDRLPEQLTVPQDTALLELSMRGQAVAFPNRDEAGRLWLQSRRQDAAPKEEARLDVSVHRKLVDEQPLELVTRVQLKVSGASREVTLGPVLPEGFVPMSLASPLPARIEGDGRLRVQARAGAWDVYVNARRQSRGDELSVGAPKGAWTENEVWVFESRPQLRLADFTGASPLDPNQTEIPGDWRSLPTFLVKPGTSVKLVERQRGEDVNSPDRLSISRELWLDFSGKGFSARDTISGTLKKSWRLEAAPEVKLGRVAVDGQDQFLTVLTTGGPSGLEVRASGVNVVADSRVEGRRITAAGWAHDFENVQAVLRLPPGWKIFHARGVDQAHPTWVSRWTLLDFFLLLVAAAAFGRLYSARWGAAALLGLALAWHEAGAPRWLWIIGLVVAALSQALASNVSAAKWLSFSRKAIFAGLVLVLVPFAVRQVRWALYPELAPPAGSVHPGGQPGYAGGGAENVMPAAAPMELEEADQSARQEMSQVVRRSKFGIAAVRGMGMNAASSYGSKMKQAQFQIDPNARVTTGAGMPYWRWNEARLTWKGPVPKDHRIGLWLIGPRLAFVLTVLRLALMVLLSLLLAGLPVGRWLEDLRAPGGLARAAGAILPLLLLSVSSRAAEFPPRDLLDELRNRLLEAPACAPNCAESPRARLKATEGWLQVAVEVHAAAATAVPIPVGGREWTPARAALDGKPAGVRRGPDGALYAAVPAGSHTLTLDGPLPERDSVQIALPLRPMRLEHSASGWSVSGVREDGRPEDSIQLSRTRAARAAEVAAREQGVFPPFLRVERVLRLGLSWTVETTVSRLTPGGQAVSAQIPLLPGEAVTSSDLRVVGGKAQFTLPPQAWSGGWTSTLERADRLKLAAPQTTLWTEHWRIEPGQIWHATADGLPRVQDESSPRALVYRPWAGETLELAVSRPSGLDGQTLTIDEANLALSPGLRATDAALSLSLRSSRGGQQTIVLPEGSELLSSKVDERPQPLRLEGRKLVVPVEPGAHKIDVGWRQPGGAKAFFRAPEIDLGAGAVNVHVQVNMPAGRWTLALGGPGVGPAVLFWALLAVFFFVSLGLGKTDLAPLSWRQWFLLSLGLTQASVFGGAIVAGWFLAVGLRARHVPEGEREFKVTQVFLVGLTLMAAVCLFAAIKAGLLGQPRMQIAGNASSYQLLRWYVDRCGQLLPRPWIFSVPLWVYRLSMLAWALWLAESLLNWSRWAWRSWTTGGMWDRTS